jgi:hypothetical protein
VVVLLLLLLLLLLLVLLLWLGQAALQQAYGREKPSVPVDYNQS